MFSRSTIGSLATAGAAILALGTGPAAAQDAPSTQAAPPVRVLTCYVYRDPASGQIGGTVIGFENTGTAPLHRVRFEVAYHTIDNDLVRTVVDAGTFAPGVRIEHQYDEYRGISFDGIDPTSCTATSAS